MLRALRLLPSVLLPALLLVSCGTLTAARPHARPNHHVAARKTSAPPPARTRPAAGNELGVIPVFEYHKIGATPARWQTTPAMLTADLAWLYNNHFWLVTMRDLETGNIDAPAGWHVAVLTFDDGAESQFLWNAQHVPTPTCSVGVLEAFQAAHPTWPVTATFYLNQSPWATDSVAKMQWLVAHGFELGNHTWDENNLGGLDAAQIEKVVGEEQAYIERAVPGYVPVSFALPYGIAPTNPQDRQALLDGTYQGTKWHFEGIALVGASVSASPFSRNWSIQIPRIQEVDPSLLPTGDLPYIMAGVEERFAKDPAAFYTSGGNPDYIPFPAADASLLSPAYAAKADPIAAGKAP